MAEFELTRLGFEMQPEAGNAMEVEGVLNPASARGPDGHLYLFPRMVSAGNFSRIGIARVRFDEAGDPVGVERLGVVLEPEADYERHGCEDPRITYIAEQRHYVMAYTAFSGDGARIAIAASKDLLTWRRLGLAQFKPYRGIAFEGINNKDASFFPHPIPDPHGRLTTALIHRPLFPGTRPEEMRHQPSCRAVNVHRESIWISYCRIVSDGNGERHCVFEHHRRLASPVEPWEQLKIGGGTPPILTPDGWLFLYHGVSEALHEANQTLTETTKVLGAINRKEGSVGQFLYDKRFYSQLTDIEAELQELLKDFKKQPRKYIKFSVF